MRRNNATNSLIMWLVIGGDFVLMNVVVYLFSKMSPRMEMWSWGEQLRMFLLISNLALLASEWKFHTIIHERWVSAGEVLKKIVQLTVVQSALAYMIMRHLMYWTSAGWIVLELGTLLFLSLALLRLIERLLIKHLRRLGLNSRTVTFVGHDPELRRLYDQLINDPAAGYRMLGYYADEKLENERVPWLGTVAELVGTMESGNHGSMENGSRGAVDLGDELYVSLPKVESETIKKLSRMCDRHVTKFYYVPRAVDAIGLNLHREFINEIEVFSTHESPLENVSNKAVKRVFDIVMSIVALILTGILFPFIYVIIKIQSPGPIFFKQMRTGLDGKNFLCYKFRSMHVNKDADKLQATKDDPRKYPFGNLMRKTNIDELPQFWNVLKGDMSIVGPRPHMLAHTEQYSQLIEKYMVRHFVKPGVTGWAQVTGYRGETKELWQMEGRVQRDIWYIEHWSFWLDIRIVWLTFKTIFVHDKNAY